MRPPDRRQRRPLATGAANAEVSPDRSRRNMLARHRKLPTAYASVFVPQGRRSWYWLTFRCPVCGTYVFARSRQIDQAPGPRKGTCGHSVSVVAARIYGRQEAA